MITAVFGDIHGCIDELKASMELVNTRNPDRYVFLGDYIDRGYDPVGVIDYIMNLQKEKDVTALMGNHEDIMLKEVRYEDDWDGTYWSQWCVNAVKFPLQQIIWIKKLPKWFDDGKRFYCHVGVDPTIDLYKQSEHFLMWSRHHHNISTGRLIVHGHTPVKEIVQKENDLNIDTGCCFGNKLTCAIFDDIQTNPLEFIQVSGWQI